MSKIFDGDSDSDAEIKTNNEYAKNYDNWRKKEEYNKLKTKYGEELLDEGSSSSSDDDDEGVELTEAVEKQFFKTLSCLKNKDPRIYDENVNFFDDPVETSSKNDRKKAKKDKPLYINDYERELILKNNSQISDDEDEAREVQNRSPTYVEEQRRIKESFKTVLNDVVENDDEEGWGGILKVRQKTEEEKHKEDADYKEWLAGQKEDIDDKEVATELKPLKEYWNNPNLDDGEKFLRDYILKKRFLSNEDEEYIPTYDEIVHDSDKDLSEDEDAIEKQEEFEHKYNFRFEEPDQDFIKRYPRTMEQSLRKTNDKRKTKRAETKERKQKEKEQKMQDLKKLQELKRKEIEEKIEKLREITGNADMEFNDEDLDGDFDPDAHDKRMQSLFNDEFYEGTEEEQKPEFPELDNYLEIENWEKWKGEENREEEVTNLEEHEPHCDDEDFNMDCDYDPTAATQNELIENSKGKKKRKRKSLFAKAVSQPKPAFDPNDKTYEEYLDEYYKLDCEDFIGDLPCRFKYRQVVPNSFGLSVEEILTANDRELNKWCSLKKAFQHRPDHVEKYDQIAFEKKAKNVDLKRRILPSLFENKKDNLIEEEEKVEPTKKKKTKKVRCVKGLTAKEDVIEENVRKETETDESKDESKEIMSEDKSPKMKTNKKKKSKATVAEKQNVEENLNDEHETPNNLSVKKNKKKRKKRQNATTGLNVSKEINTNNGKMKKQKTESDDAQEASANKKNNGNNFAGVKIQKSGKKRKHNNANKGSTPNKKARMGFKDKSQDIGISDARLSAYGINPKKFKNKLKYKGRL